MKSNDKDRNNKPVCLANSGDNNICDADGVYAPVENLAYRKAVKRGEQFPRYEGKIVQGVSVDGY